MRRLIFLLAACLCLVVPGVGRRTRQGEKDANQNQPPPRSDTQQGSRGEFEPRYPDRPQPAQQRRQGSSQQHSAAGRRDENTSADVQEFHTFDPHRAAKDIEVGDFYFKRKNYVAALERYREALLYKPNDAVANLHMAQALEKLDRLDEAAERYQEYLRILPNGPQAEEAKKALEKIKAKRASRKRSSQAIILLLCHPERNLSIRWRMER